MTTDRRPDPKPRKNPHLWQAYLNWNEMMELRKRHTLRISSIDHGKSNMDAQFERDYLEAMGIETLVKNNVRVMIAAGRELGPVWTWITSIRGMASGSLPAQLLAQIDDPGKFETISKLWAFSGWAVRDGKIDRCERGKTAPYNRTLKSTCYLCVQQFVYQQTPVYSDLYYEEKDRQLQLHPVPICSKCGGAAVQVGQQWRCGECGQKNTNHALKYTPGHIDAMAKRKVAKIFLQHVWLVWRQCDGLPVSEPWIQAIGGHSHIVPPPNMDAIGEAGDA